VCEQAGDEVGVFPCTSLQNNMAYDSKKGGTNQERAWRQDGARSSRQLGSLGLLSLLPRLNPLRPYEIRCARLLQRISLGELVFYEEFNGVKVDRVCCDD
jgi:hypothetical protein